MLSILVVDDDQAFREALCRSLGARGHETEAARDGQDAIRRFQQTPRDLVITDIIMPDGDGIELIARLRRDHPQVKILAVSGRGRLGALDLLDLASKLGADAVLPKPFSADELMVEIERLGRTCS